MKNDLLQLKKERENGDINIFEEELKETKEGKIRNSIYYIISRSIKFSDGDTDLLKYFLEKC